MVFGPDFSALTNLNLAHVNNILRDVARHAATRIRRAIGRAAGRGRAAQAKKKRQTKPKKRGVRAIRGRGRRSDGRFTSGKG